MDGLNNDTAPGLILVKTALDRLFDQVTIEQTVVAKATALDPVIFTQDTAVNAAVNSSVIGGGGYFEKTIDDLSPAEDAPIQAAPLKVTIVAQFKKNLPISRTFMDDQQESAVAKSVRQQADTWIASRDRNAMYVYANGFTTQTTIDGVALFSNAHVNENNNTVDNYYTGAISDTNLNISVNALRTQLAQTGVKIGYEPKFILTPSITHVTATQIAKSVLRAGTGNNDLNYFSEMYPGMKVMFSTFIDDITTTAFFLGSQTHGVVRFEREAFFTKLVPWETDSNDRYIYKMRAREEVDSIEYSGLVANDGTTS